LAALALSRSPLAFQTLVHGSAGAGGIYALGKRLKSLLQRRPYLPEHTPPPTLPPSLPPYQPPTLCHSRRESAVLTPTLHPQTESAVQPPNARVAPKAVPEAQ
ncbi:MAG: hypothetical protein M3O02_09985, partial [Acidobacteriota bacterium]|nr:hypothetical protein [Acidobacteriota bacterium]